MTEADARRDEELPTYRYDARLANEIEAKWQDRWEAEHTFWAPNPEGPLSEGFAAVADRKKLFVLDMFPYPSGAGLHVGHPLGYIGTDVYARFKRMTGHNVLHAMGYDAFGLPAEQYAVQTGQHPRVTTEANIANMRRQLRALGLGHDPRRSVDNDGSRVLPLDAVDLPAALRLLVRRGRRPCPPDRRADPAARGRPGRRVGRALAARAARARRRQPARVPRRGGSQLVPGARNGPGERGGHRRRDAASGGTIPVYRRPLKQWMLRITAYAERLLADLDLLDWTDSIKLMQRNWIGRSVGAEVDFGVEGHEDTTITVFTTRPDTLFGATYMVLAPEHPLVDDDHARGMAGGVTG